MRSEPMNLLYQHAADLEVDVEWCYLDGKRGCWRKGDNLILLDYRLSLAQAEFTFAHELAHVIYVDTKKDPRIERRADLLAASLIIETADYKRAEWIAGHDAGSIAIELGTTKRAVEAWRTWYQIRGRELERIGALA